MSEVTLEGIELLRIVRADGNLTVSGAKTGPVEIDSSPEARVNRDGACAEVSLVSNAGIRVPAGVTVEISECSGQLDLEDLNTPTTLGRVHGNLRVRRMGALTIRDRIDGNARVEGAGAVQGGDIAGNLRIERVQSVVLGKVAGNFEVKEIEHEATIERIGGGLFAEKTGGAIRCRSIGGKLYVDRAAEVDIETVGGKARVNDVTGNVRIGTVGGRAVVQGAGGDVKIATVDGHAMVAGVAGGVELPEVGGALDFRGPLPAGKFWGAQSRGRISVEVDATSSLDVTAASRWGHVRVFGLDTANLQRPDHRSVKGTLGTDKPQEERTRMALETHHADIIFAQAGAQDRDYCGRGGRWSRRFGPFEELGEILSEELGTKIPEFVNSILGAAGQFVASSGTWSGGFVRSAAEEAARSVRDAMGDAERAFGELGEKLPRDIANSIEEFGRRLSEIIRRATAEGLGRTRSGRDEVRDRIRESAIQMRDSIHAAVREAREKRPSPTTGSPSATTREKPSQTRPFSTAANRGDIMDILHGVKEGRISPDEADEMIAALKEVERATESRGN